MTAHHGEADYDQIYRDAAGSGGPPWQIGGPQPALAQVLDGRVKGPEGARHRLRHR